MKNTKAGKNGFVMLLVIFFLAAVSMWMMLLAFNAKVFLFQADRAYLDACRQNLVASGLAWSQKNADSFKTKSTAIELDIADMNIKRAALSITIISAKKVGAQIEINTTCAKGEQKLLSSEKFNIPTQP